jgi:hypothetical protein
MSDVEPKRQGFVVTIAAGRARLGRVESWDDLPAESVSAMPATATRAMVRRGARSWFRRVQRPHAFSYIIYYLFQ